MASDTSSSDAEDLGVSDERTTLTFLLASLPYGYSSLVIGLFAFNGIAGICLGPLFVRYVSNEFPPLYSVIFGELICLVGVTIGTYTGAFTVGGPTLRAFAIELRLQMSQTAQRSAIQEIEPSARNRINTAYKLVLLTDGLWERLLETISMLKAAGSEVGVRASVSLKPSLLICLARGPWATAWVGWGGGWSRLKRRARGDQADEKQREDANISETDQIRADMSSNIEGGMVGDNAGSKTVMEFLQHQVIPIAQKD